MTNQVWLLLSTMLVNLQQITASHGVTASGFNLLLTIVIVVVIVADVVIMTVFLAVRGRKHRPHAQMNRAQRFELTSKCPVCGAMLDPGVRSCTACRHPTRR